MTFTEGPEPSYIISGENGLLFEYNDPEEGVFDALRVAFDNSIKLRVMQVKAYKTYEKLIQPPLAMRLVNIINGCQLKELS